ELLLLHARRDRAEPARVPRARRLAVRTNVARHQDERDADDQRGLPAQPPPVRGVRAVGGDRQLRRRALRPPQPLRQSGLGVVPDLGRGGADGDRRRQRDDRRTAARIGDRARAAQLGEQLLRAARRGDGTGLHRRRAVGAQRPGRTARVVACESEGRPMTTPAIELVDVGKRYGGLQAVESGTLAVAPGERRVLIGPNGAGKTPLFHCVTGTVRASSGRIRLFGTDVTRLDEASRTRLGMGRTFQISNVFMDLTVVENVLLALLGKDRRKWTTYRTLRTYAQMHEQALDRLAVLGLQARANETVRLLSYGERRQLELALALATAPRVLFLDEPCAGLSP